MSEFASSVDRLSAALANERRAQNAKMERLEERLTILERKLQETLEALKPLTNVDKQIKTAGAALEWLFTRVEKLENSQSR